MRNFPPAGTADSFVGWNCRSNLSGRVIDAGPREQGGVVVLSPFVNNDLGADSRIGTYAAGMVHMMMGLNQVGDRLAGKLPAYPLNDGFGAVVLGAGLNDDHAIPLFNDQRVDGVGRDGDKNGLLAQFPGCSPPANRHPWRSRPVSKTASTG